MREPPHTASPGFIWLCRSIAFTVIHEWSQRARDKGMPLGQIVSVGQRMFYEYIEKYRRLRNEEFEEARRQKGDSNE